ncbi:DUF3060 domain-containing protein [Mycobacterium conspicuum]|jgi:hypothetical protein|uniref:Uncharacterized protein n=1 Tax=Mycobacterium conspicuum TaxID=44010 RepID=A0A1X1TB03_9MYCO|nr:DUF3060 domain-containing protein [Mycobacterium conspicuum]ORV41750.1 hypothetical protein AWC00_13190 [Mycobacterium conspicuum]BBZ40657.1 hypothetical protein MCNS_37200 [Mycobacterium conspicuum]
MNTPDPEDYIREHERGINQPSDTPRPRPLQGVAKLANTTRGRLVLACAVAGAVAIAVFLGQYAGKTTVHGNLTMINNGAKDTIDCNDGNLRLDGDNNTYTVTGHCRRLDIFGSANHVVVDSADTIGAFGDDNAVIYHSGSPTINKTGNNNTVWRGQSTR